jgi:hypothetical protein
MPQVELKAPSLADQGVDKHLADRGPGVVS